VKSKKILYLPLLNVPNLKQSIMTQKNILARMLRLSSLELLYKKS